MVGPLIIEFTSETPGGARDRPQPTASLFSPIAADAASMQCGVCRPSICAVPRSERWMIGRN